MKDTVTNTSNDASASNEEERSPALVELEIACVDLLCQLENDLAVFKGAAVGDRVDGSIKVAKNVIRRLTEFSEQQLTGEGLQKSEEKLALAKDACAYHDEMLNNRSWSDTIKGLFNASSVDANSHATHKALGKAVSRASATTFYQATRGIGLETAAGKRVAQSGMAFIKELEAGW